MEAGLLRLTRSNRSRSHHEDLRFDNEASDIDGLCSGDGVGP